MATNYNVSIARLIELLLPISMRSASVVAMLRAAFAFYTQSTIERTALAEMFATARASDNFEATHNGQVCYLRAALNAKFKSNLGIYFRIAESSSGVVWPYAATEADIVGHIYASTEKSTTGHVFAPDESVMDSRNSFIVYVPSDLYAEPMLSRIKLFVNKYRLVTRIPQYEPINS